MRSSSRIMIVSSGSVKERDHRRGPRNRLKSLGGRESKLNSQGTEKGHVHREKPVERGSAETSESANVKAHLSGETRGFTARVEESLQDSFRQRRWRDCDPRHERQVSRGQSSAMRAPGLQPWRATTDDHS